MVRLIKIISILFAVYISIDAQEPDRLWLKNWRFRFTARDSSFSYAQDSVKNAWWLNVTIPHSYNNGQDIAKHTKGFGWYITEITIKRKAGEELFLEFGGVALRCKVFINGELAGKNRLAYLPFRVPVKAVDQQTIQIAVQVDNRLLKRDIPDVSCNGWWIYGGLVREVALVRLPVKRVENCQIRTVYAGPDSFHVFFSCDTVQCKPDSIAICISGDGEIQHGFRVAADDTFFIGGINAWSPENPVLYNFTITPFWNGEEGRTVTIKRGFCQLSVKNAKLLLNGKPIFIRGVGRHDVGKHAIGHGLTREERREDLLAIKSLGANMLRIAHFPQHHDIYEICDSIGLIVMDEMPAWKSPPGLLGDSFRRRKLFAYMDALIDAHGNHTCLGIWCVGNEINGMNYSVKEYVKAMADFMKQKDHSRIFTYTSFFYQFDKAFEYADIIAINEYFGWYLGSVDMLNSLFTSIHKNFPDKPIVVTEFGAAAAFGIRNKEATLAGPIKSVFTKDFSEDYQALLIKEQIKTIWRNRKICNGAVVWCYNDFMENRKMPNPKILESGITGLGIVTEERKKKLVFNTVKREFKAIRMEMIKNNGY